MRAKSSKPTDLIRFNVYRIRKSPAEVVGTVSAKDEATAIDRVAEEKGITDPGQLKRLFVRPSAQKKGPRAARLLKRRGEPTGRRRHAHSCSKHQSRMQAILSMRSGRNTRRSRRNTSAPQSTTAPLPDPARAQLSTFLDAGGPDSVAAVFTAHGYHAILHREVLPERISDDVVAATAMANGAILVAIDPDMKQFPKRFGISHGSPRFTRLSIIQICCNETLSAKRLEQAMSFIEHEWSVSGEKAARRLWVEIGPHFLRTNR